jgi:hypothetical protein
MLEGEVTNDTADHSYDDRLEMLLCRAESHVRDIVAPDGNGRPGWRHFIELWRRMGAGSRRALPEAPRQIATPRRG